VLAYRILTSALFLAFRLVIVVAIVADLRAVFAVIMETTAVLESFTDDLAASDSA
jgi:hypothetical protein